MVAMILRDSRARPRPGGLLLEPHEAAQRLREAGWALQRRTIADLIAAGHLDGIVDHRLGRPMLPLARLDELADRLAILGIPRPRTS